MKIASVDVILSHEPAVHPVFRWRHGLPGSEPARTTGWLVITTDDGIRGYAHSQRGVILADIVDRRIRSELVGVDPIRREWLWHRMWELDRIETFPNYVIGVIDDALWDIAGKATGEPVHRMLGTFRDSIPAYASTATYRDIDEYLDVADQCRELGYSAIKLHAWGDARADAQLITALRAHLGDKVPLMYDGSAGFDLADAVYVGQALGDAGYLWYEEPMREHNVTAYRWLSERVSVPLLVGEVSAGAHMSTADFVASGCATAVRTGTGLRGGVTGAMRTAHLADAFRLRAEVHGMGLPNTHLCMAIPNTTYFESLVTASPVQRGPEVDSNGLVHAPSGSGMGYEQLWGSDSPPVSARG